MKRELPKPFRRNRREKLRQLGRAMLFKIRNRCRTIDRSFLGRDGGTGRRSGLKIRRPSGLGGSTPPPGTNRLGKNRAAFACCVCSTHPVDLTLSSFGIVATLNVLILNVLDPAFPVATSAFPVLDRRMDGRAQI